MVFEVTNAKKKTVKCKKAISKKVKKVMIPAAVVVSTKSGKQSFTVTEIAPKAFSNCKKLKKVVIGKNVQTIGKSAFEKATKDYDSDNKIKKGWKKCDQRHS